MSEAGTAQAADPRADDGAGVCDAGAPASLGARIPWPEEPDAWPDIDPGDAFDLFLDWTFERGIELWPHQEDACLALAAGEHVVLGTPTGSGKSLVAQWLCFLAICTDRRAYYTAPIKALVSEKFFDLCDVLGKDCVGMITGDTAINVTAPVICCTAEILANDALRSGEHADIGCVAMDEFHYYGDAQRGWAWQVPLLTLPHTQFLLMSATLGDMGAIAESLEQRTGRLVTDISDAPRPVPLDYAYAETPLTATVELALRGEGAPLYLVHFAQDAAYRNASDLASYGVSTKQQRAAIRDALAGTNFNTAFGTALRRLLLNGVGVHHAGMLPRYRLLVERLAQQGLLPVICGTDTLGVGINVPIRTVVLTALAKYDGHRQRRLNAREFHQIAGRAGRAGFDTCGHVIAQATETDIERAQALAKAGGDEKKARKVKVKQPPKGFVGWKREHFEHLVEATPETLRPHLRITHSMVLCEVEQGGDARARTYALIDASAQDDATKGKLVTRCDEIFETLIAAGVVVCTADESGAESYTLTVELPDDFALDQPLSPFLLAALELLDPESDSYALDVISMAEATLEDPWQILRAQQKAARDAAIASMKAEGLDYDERMERLEDVTYPKPLEELLDAAFERYCEAVPWARDYALSPKSILRDMVESASDFKGYVARYGIARSEGTLLRYLSDAYRVLERTVPPEKRDETLEDIVRWLGLIVRTTDSSLIDEWAGTGEADVDGTSIAAPQARDAVVADRRACTLLVRNALIARVGLIARGDYGRLGELDEQWGWPMRRWKQELDALSDEHDEVLLDGDARSARYIDIDESDEASAHVWHVRQMLHDADGDDDWGIAADVELDATQQLGQVTFSNYRFGPIELLLA